MLIPKSSSNYCSVWRFSIISFIILTMFSSKVLGADSASATRTVFGGSCTTTSTGNFSVTTAQVATWSANVFSMSGACGNGDNFYLNKNDGGLVRDVILSNTLSLGLNNGTVSLVPGINYSILITDAGTPRGNYSVTYNIMAGVEVTTSSSDFGSILDGATSAPKTFTIMSSGDIDLQITNVSTSNANFELQGSIPTGMDIPPNRVFDVVCRGLSVGTHTGTVSVIATGGGQTVSDSVNVSCTVEPLEPNLTCFSNTNLGEADWLPPDPPITSGVRLRNEGNANLVISNITLNTSAPAGIFALGSIPLGTMSPGSFDDAFVIFDAGAAGGEGVFSGNLVVFSNDPDEPVKTCNFSARSHHPEPEIRIEELLLDFHEVELGFEFTKGIFIYNDGDATLNVSVSDTIPLSADIAQWSLRETGTTTVAPMTALGPAIFKQTCGPSLIGSFSTSMNVSSNDADEPNLIVNMTCDGSLPVPIDAILVLDRSGSMNTRLGTTSPRKIEALRTAASLFTDLLNIRAANVLPPESDRIGFVKYNHVNSIYLPLDYARDAHFNTAMNNRLSAAAITDVAELRPDGFTWIGGAVQTAGGILATSASDRKHVMVVLTDGIETESPEVTDVMPAIIAADPDLKVYSIGLGEDSVVDIVALQNITNIANGFHQVENELSGTHVFDLESFYFKIFSNASDLEIIVDPTFVINVNSAAPVIIDTARISSSDRSATFVVLDLPELRSMYDLELIDPSGSLIVLGSDVGGVPVHIQERNNYRIYHVVFPDINNSTQYVGDWILQLNPNDNWDPKRIHELLNASGNPLAFATDGGVAPLNGQVPIAFAAAVSSNYKFNVAVNSSAYLPGAEVTLTARLTDRGWPAPNGQVYVNIETPNGTTFNGRQMYDDGSHGDVEAGDGLWTTRFVSTSEAGSYRFLFESSGYNEHGELAPRQQTRYLSLWQPPRDVHEDDDCISCLLQKWLWGIVIGLLILSLLCCYYRSRKVG